MPVLSNARQERFAQALAAGKPADAAYVEAGYNPNRGNASTLKSNQNVEARVAEILSNAAKRTEVTIETLTAMYLADRALARDNMQAAAAITAVTGIAKLHGLIIDKKELGRPGDFEKMTDDELDRYIEERSGRSRPSHKDPGTQGNPPVLQ